MKKIKIDVLDELLVREEHKLPNYIDLNNTNIEYIDFENIKDVPITNSLKNGYIKRKDGYFISTYVKAPIFLLKMIDWYIFSYLKDDKRFKAIYPSKHISLTSSNSENKIHFQIKEIIGNKEKDYRLFLTKEDNLISLYIADEKERIHSFAYIFIKEIDNELNIRVYLYLGYKYSNKLNKKLIFNKRLAKDIYEHISIELANIVDRLSILYSNFS